jgi:hypothetical protein
MKTDAEFLMDVSALPGYVNPQPLWEEDKHQQILQRLECLEVKVDALVALLSAAESREGGE